MTRANTKAFQVILGEIQDGNNPDDILRILKLQDLDNEPAAHNLSDIVLRYETKHSEEKQSTRERG